MRERRFECVVGSLRSAPGIDATNFGGLFEIEQYRHHGNQ